MRLSPWLFGAWLSLVSCRAPLEPGASPRPAPEGPAPSPSPRAPAEPGALSLLPPLASAETTLVRRLSPARARLSPPDAENPALPAWLGRRVAEGFGALVEAPGERVRPRSLLGKTPPPPGPRARRLARFVHLSDAHITDNESPARVADFDAPGPTNGALRPGDGDLCALLNAAVRTINALDRQDPVDLVLLGGDNIDNAQSNELRWALGILSGAPEVRCDSGDSDAEGGGFREGKRPFGAEGLRPPYLWVTGNHDVLTQGTAPVALAAGLVTGGWAPGGTRDYRRGGEVDRGRFVVPDPGRAQLSRRELLSRIAADGDGHGLRGLEGERAFYHFDLPGTPLRFVVLDTAAETGGPSGLLRAEDVSAHLEPELALAEREGKAVILVAHHPADGLSPDGGKFGERHEGAMTPRAFAERVGAHPAVLFSLAGHAHRHRVRAVRPAPQGRAFWEVTTGALADFPHQFRLLEVWDQDNGFISLRSTCVDVAVVGDPAAAAGRERGVVDYVAGWSPDGPGTPDDRNVELFVAWPGEPPPRGAPGARVGSPSGGG